LIAIGQRSVSSICCRTTHPSITVASLGNV
jgi:hypothetical protein